MMTFTAHASGSGGNFYVVEDQGSTLAIECGIPFSQIKRATKFKVAYLDGCLISHAHGDHACAVKDMIKHGCVHCYASHETWAAIPSVPLGEIAAKRLQADGFDEKGTKIYRRATVGDFRVLPFEVPHDVPGCLGFLVKGPSGDTLLYISDLCYSPYRFADCQILAVECNHSTEILRRNMDKGIVDPDRGLRIAKSHMSLERLLDMLAATDLSGVRAIHLLHLSDCNSNEAEFKDKVTRATGRPVYVAQSRSF